MIETYTPEQQRAIQEKIELFKDIKEKGFSSDEEHKIRKRIYEKRMKWLKENFDQSSKKLKKYKTAVEKAFRLVFFEYMKTNPKDVEVEFLPKRKNAKAVFIKSKNFCPYLEAFKELELDSINYCRMTLEEPVTYLANKFLSMERFKYGVWFGRNYYDLRDLLGIKMKPTGIRPDIGECQEYFIDRSLDVIEFRILEEMCKTGLDFDYESARKYVTLDF